MKLYIFLIIFVLVFSCNSQNKSSENRISHTNIDLQETLDAERRYVLDTTMVKSIDLSNRPENEIAKYHLKVLDWTKPLNWEFYILSNSDTLLHEYSNEANIDAFFHDNLYVRDCEDYIDCKKKWYLNYIFNFEVEKVLPGDSRIPLFKNVSRNFAEDNNSAFGNSKDEAIKNYNYFWEYYSDKNMNVIYFNFAPEGRSTPILVFHPGMNKLVPIYSP